MWDLSLSLYEAVALLIGAATLAAIVWYAWLTDRLRRAASDQTEALFMPFLVPVLGDRPAERASVETASAQLRGSAVLIPARALRLNTIRLINIGSGPAVRVRYQQSGQTGNWVEDAEIREGEEFFPLYRQASASAGIRVCYESMSARHYDLELAWAPRGPQYVVTKLERDRERMQRPCCPASLPRFSLEEGGEA